MIDLLYNSFNYIVRLILYRSNKILKQIQQIIIYMKQINLVDKTISVIFKAAIMFCFIKSKINNKYFFYKCKRYYLWKYLIKKRKWDNNQNQNKKQKKL